MERELKYVIFDLDDTLLNTGYYYESNIKKFAKDLGKRFNNKISYESICEKQEEIDIAEVTKSGFTIKRFPLSLVKTYQHYCKKQRIPTERSVEVYYYNLGFEVFKKIPEFFEGTEEVLNVLYKKYHLILYTLGDRRIQSRKIIYHNLARWFPERYIVTKKNKRQLKRIIGERDPLEFAIIGDSLKSEIAPAVDLGLMSILFKHSTTWKYNHADVEKPYKIINRISELLKIL